MIPPEVVRMRASSTVFAKASSLVNRDLAAIGLWQLIDDHTSAGVDSILDRLGCGIAPEEKESCQSEVISKVSVAVANYEAIERSTRILEHVTEDRARTHLI
jgi:hypothetical protein